ncbi:hypothetical protein [Leptospira meyeri]|uniref:hypothetical protein n=1 Tax=Leptospira meyeri TaxID=29508 RepID=UPI001AEFF469|nr:hypothetical protein [Leptospira meyeri]
MIPIQMDQLEYKAPTQVPQISESAFADLATATLIFFRSNLKDDFSIVCLEGSKPQGKDFTPPFSTWTCANSTFSKRMSVYKLLPLSFMNHILVRRNQYKSKIGIFFNCELVGESQKQKHQKVLGNSGYTRITQEFKKHSQVNHLEPKVTPHNEW